MTVGLLWVALGALLFGAGTLVQAYALGTRRLAGTPVLRAARDPLFLLGGLAEGGGALAHVVALQSVPMAVAQASVCGSLAVTALGARLVLGTRIGTRGVVAVGVLSAALVALAAVSGESGALTDTGPATVALATATAVLALGVTGLPTLPPRCRSGVAAVLSGLGFAACSIATRLLDTTTALGLLTDPALLVLAAAGALGALTWTVALRHGSATTVTAVVVVCEVVPPSLLGPWLGDTAGTAFAVLAPVALLAASVAAVTLARVETTARARATRRPGAVIVDVEVAPWQPEHDARSASPAVRPVTSPSTWV
jgi:drug/metabolite transporter (DMT)-like permease